MDDLNWKLVICKNYRIESETVTVVEMYIVILSSSQIHYFTYNFLFIFSMKKDDDAIEVVSSLSEEIYTALLTPEDHYQELKPTIPVAMMKKKTETHTSENCSNETAPVDSKKLTHVSMASLPVSVGNSSKNYLTLAGTIKRGKLPQKSLDIQLSVTPDHLSKLEKRVHDKYHDRCFCGLRRGPHVFLISLLSIPFMLVYSLFQAFFLGSMTWYNIFLHYNEDSSCCHKLLSPFVLLFYPFWIVPVTIIGALYGLVRPISWYWDSWLSEVRNPDGGFFTWACTIMNLADCAPYQVVLLSAEESPHHATKIHQGCHTIEKVWPDASPNYSCHIKNLLHPLLIFR